MDSDEPKTPPKKDPGPPAAPATDDLKAINDTAKSLASLVENLRKTTLSEVKPPDGNRLVDDKSPVEMRILAYRAIDEIGKDIAKRVLEKGKRVAILDPADVAGLLAYRAFDAQLGALETQVCDAIETARKLIEAPATADFAPGLVAALPVAAAVLRGIIDVLALFRTDVSVKNHEVTIGESTLIAAVLGALAGEAEAYHPAVLPPNLLDEKKSAVGTRLAALDAFPPKLKRLAGELSRLADAKPANEAVLRESAQVLTATDEALAEFRKALVAADAQKAAPLTGILRAELLEALRQNNLLLLTLKVGTAGGNVKSERGLWTLGSTDLSFSGGAVAEYVLHDNTGKVVSAGVVPSYFGERGADEILT